MNTLVERLEKITDDLAELIQEAPSEETVCRAQELLLERLMDLK